MLNSHFWKFADNIKQKITFIIFFVALKKKGSNWFSESVPSKNTEHGYNYYLANILLTSCCFFMVENYLMFLFEN